jgi:hypothetical protein
LLAGYPRGVRRVFYWYDGLTDRQRVQYACIAILFLLACGGYLLGLGSTILLQRVEAQEAILAAEPLPMLESAAAGLAEVAPSPPPSSTPLPSPTSVPPTAAPTQTPFTAPVIAEPPAAPRQLPAAPVVVAPVAPRATPTLDKPRNLETSKPEPPAASLATPTPGLVRTVRPTPAVGVRQVTPAATVRPTGLATPLPTLALPATNAPTAGPAQTPTHPPAGPTPAKTPSVH